MMGKNSRGRWNALLSRKGEKAENVPKKSLKNVILESLFRSVSMRLFLLIFCGILVCVASLGLFSYNQSSTIIKNKVSQATIETTTALAGKLKLMFESYERQSLQFITDSEFTSSLNTLTTTTEQYDRFDATRKVTDKLNGVTMADSNYVGITLIPLTDKGQFVSTNSVLNRQAAAESPYIELIKNGNGRAVWVPTQMRGFDLNSPVPTITVGRLLNVGSPYVLIMEIKSEKIDSEMNIDLGDGSSMYLVGSDNIIATGPERAIWGETYPYNLPDETGKATIYIDGAEQLSAAGIVEGNEWKVVANIPVTELVKDTKEIRDVTLIVSFFAILIAIGIGFIVVRIVGRPLVQIRNLMNDGEKGNLTVRANIRQKDEIGQLAESFNRMMEEITNLVRKTNDSAEEVMSTASELTESSRKTAGAAREIAVATEEIASGATNLAVESEKGTDLTIQIGSQVQGVISSNTEMGQSANEVATASHQGTTYMNTLIQKTGQTEDMTRAMVEKVNKLKESTGSVRKILEVLGNISKQTNILSLNATIEAARAGAAGKGFMVVADEVRKLADQSRESIEIVGQIIETIQREIDETVEITSEAYPLFQEQIASVREANQIFIHVQENMSGFIERLDSATDSVRNLEGAQNTLAMAMSNVSAVAEEASATSEEVASLSNEQLGISQGLVVLSNRLETVSTKLQESLNRFTVD